MTAHLHFSATQKATVNLNRVMTGTPKRPAVIIPSIQPETLDATLETEAIQVNYANAWQVEYAKAED